MSANSSLVQFLPDEDNQNLHVKMYKKYVQPGLICTEMGPKTCGDRAPALQERRQVELLHSRDSERLLCGP